MDTVPIEITLVSGNDLDFLVAADTINDLVQYHVYSYWQCSQQQRAVANKLLAQKTVYFLDANKKARLLDCSFSYVRVELLEDASGKAAGGLCWVHRSNVAWPVGVTPPV